MIGPLAVKNLLDGPLFAIGVEDVITIVVFLVIAIISAISQYFNKQKEKAARQRRLEEQDKRRATMADLDQQEQPHQAPEPQRQFGRLQERPKLAAAPVNEDVATEIRDFLERAATGRPAGQAPAHPKPVPPAVAVPLEEKYTPLADRPAHRTSIEQRSTPTSHPGARPVEAKIISERQLTDQDRRQAEAIRAKKQAEAKKHQAQAAQTTQKGGSKFDRQLGSLKKQSRSQPETLTPETLTPETMASDIAAMFASTENLRQAIVINEILTRPVHRWE